MTGFQAKPVSGYVPAFLFFDCLRRREFPTTITIRSGNQLDYLPEPDIFHDVAGHVPMHTEKAFAEALVRFGDCAHTAVEVTAGIRDEKDRGPSPPRQASQALRLDFGSVVWPHARSARHLCIWQRFAEFLWGIAARHRFRRSRAVSDSDRIGDQPDF